MNVRNSKSRVLAGAAVLCLALSLSVAGMGQAVADQIKSTYAEIVNGPGNPIPITGKVTGTVDIGKLPPMEARQSGPWSVDIAKMPPVAFSGQVQCEQSGSWTVQLDKASRCGCGPQEVTNSAESPLYVRDVNQPRTRTPYQYTAGRSGTFGGSYNVNMEALISSISVPPGKRFIAEHVMATVAPSNAGFGNSNVASAYLSVDDGSGLPISFLFLPLVNQGEIYPGRQLFVGNQPVKLVVPPGGNISLIGVQRNGANQASYGIISGYFEDL